jgi:flagellar P-ring protein precursor FlgI
MIHSIKAICRHIPRSPHGLLVPVLLAILFVQTPALGQSRIKDIVFFEGVRTNQLVGYGLVVGLNGTGDSLNTAIFTRESLIGMLEMTGCG